VLLSANDFLYRCEWSYSAAILVRKNNAIAVPLRTAGFSSAELCDLDDLS
jgi:hypothetical protein